MTNPSDELDAIGPHDAAPPAGGIVDGGDAEDTPALDFDDDEIYSGRSRVHEGGTTHGAGGDSGALGPPSEQLSSNNAPSDPDDLP